MGSHSFLQGIFPTLGLNPGLLNCKWILFSLSHRGCQRISRVRSVIFLNSVSQSKHLVYNLPLVCKLPSCSSICFLKSFLWENVICYPILLAICSVAQLFPTLCKPMDCSPRGFCVRGIFRSRILQWVAISSSRGSFPPRDGTHISCVLHCRQILYHCATCLDKLRSVYFILSFFTAN